MQNDQAQCCLLLMCGVPGAGKSALARLLVAHVASVGEASGTRNCTNERAIRPAPARVFLQRRADVTRRALSPPGAVECLHIEFDDVERQRTQSDGTSGVHQIAHSQFRLPATFDGCVTDPPLQVHLNRRHGR